MWISLRCEIGRIIVIERTRSFHAAAAAAADDDDDDDGAISHYSGGDGPATIWPIAIH